MALPTPVRIPLKAVMFPIRIVISIFTGTTGFVLKSTVVNRIFGLISAVFLIGFAALAWSAIFVQHDMPLVVRILMPCVALLTSYAVSPFSGVLKYLRLLIEKIEGLNSRLKEI